MKPMEEYSWVRGFCYGYGHGKTVETMDRELGYAQRLNLNSTRIWLSYEEYWKNPNSYVQSLVNFVRLAWSKGISTMPILWNGNGIDIKILEPSYWEEEGDSYVTAIVNALKDEPGLIMWDIMNEPSCNDYIKKEEDPEVKAKKYETMWAFVRHYCEFVKSLDPENAITVGHTYAWDVEPTVDCVDVISFHDYFETRKVVSATYDMIMELVKKYNKPYLNSELACLGRSNPYDMALEICEEYKAGWYLFELMIEGYWSDVHGIVYPDGTVRDPAIISAIMGFYRKRDLATMVKPNPNKEGYVNRAIDMMREALTDKTELFKGERSSAEGILEACEWCANMLECCEMVPMYEPPTARLREFRKQENPDIIEVRKFGYELIETLKKYCQII